MDPNATAKILLRGLSERFSRLAEHRLLGLSLNLLHLCGSDGRGGPFSASGVAPLNGNMQHLYERAVA